MPNDAARDPSAGHVPLHFSHEQLLRQDIGIWGLQPVFLVVPMHGLCHCEPKLLVKSDGLLIACLHVQVRLHNIGVLCSLCQRPLQQPGACSSDPASALPMVCSQQAVDQPHLPSSSYCPDCMHYHLAWAQSSDENHS